MATEDIGVRITGKDETAGAINSATNNFDKLLQKLKAAGMAAGETVSIGGQTLLKTSETAAKAVDASSKETLQRQKGYHREATQAVQEALRAQTFQQRQADRAAREAAKTQRDQQREAERAAKALEKAKKDQERADEQAARAEERARRDRNRGIDRTSDAMGAMIGQFATWGAAIEGARRAFGRFGDIDAQMRMIQNRTGATKEEIESLTPAFRRVARETATAFDDVVKGFNELRAEGQLPLAQTRDMMETVARAAKGIGISVQDAGSITGTIIRQFHIAPNEIGKAWDMMARATREYGLSLDQTISQMPELTTAAKALGYSGTEGFARLLFYIGSVRRETGSTAEAVHALKTLMEMGPSESMAKFLDRDAKLLRENLKNAQDPVAELIGMIRYAVEFQGRDLAQLPLRLQGPIKQLMKDYMGLYTETNKLKEAFGEAEDAGKRMGAGPRSDLDRLSEELDKARAKVGELLATFNMLGRKEGDQSHLGDFIQDIDNFIKDTQALADRFERLFSFEGGERIIRSVLDPLNNTIREFKTIYAFIARKPWDEPVPHDRPPIPKELTPAPKPLYNLPPGVPAPTGTYDPKELQTPPGVPAIPPTRTPMLEQTPRAIGPSQTPSRPSAPGGRIEDAWQQEYENRARTPNTVADSWEAEIKSRQEAERRMQRLNDELRRATENFTRINYELQEMQRGLKKGDIEGEGGGEDGGEGGGGGGGGGGGRGVVPTGGRGFRGGTAGRTNLRYGGQGAVKAGGGQGPGAGGIGRTPGAGGELAHGQGAALLDAISKAEGTRGYSDSFNHQLTQDLTGKTLNEIDQIQAGMKGSSAIGRYQFMRTTLKGLRRELGLSGQEKFTPELQDRLGRRLLQRRGYDKFMRGEMPREQFMKNLSTEWAGVTDAAGRSTHAGVGLNRQTESTVSSIDAAIARDRAGYRGPAEGGQPTARDRGGFEANKAPGNVQDNLSALNQVLQGARAEGADITSSYRPPGHGLSRANPRSAHTQGRAFDLRARTPEEADAQMAAQRARFAKMGLEEGTHYTMKDEVRHPSPWATGPHVHTQLTPAGVQALRERGQGRVQPETQTQPEASRTPPEAQGPPAPPTRPVRSPDDPLPGQGRPEQPGRISGLDEAKQVRAELEEPIKLNFAREPGSEQFARSSLRRQADREMRDARMSSFTDIGAA